ncbi:uncharacterized protein A1O9_06718 [Exophiala aquamarina CBS 119918]|uniref:SHSP domain-containing protein n=1 Tax=Exophiala aquamarina CBS 119918 TaxID=1182545 RepID=A0A072P9I2_9EURO|nr:uncharacterized protein A1O9_06718 [Exophiala aquamarina CBS 119918]KEF56531.1 hypothetical protein A1O9_06718 [Exophiala aquamarina CBS 119918]
MPPIYYLNPPPNPFWDFVASLEDHPFFGPRGRPVPPTPPPQPPRSGTQEQPTPGPSEKTKGKQTEAASADDPPEVDPSTLRGEGAKEVPFRGRGRFGNAFNNDKDDKEKDDGSDGDKCRRRGGPGCHGKRGWHRGGPGAFGPPPFAFGPPWARHGHPGPGDFPEGRGGPWGRGWGPRGRGGPHHHHHHGRHGHDSPSPPRGGFDLSTFLNNLGERIGIDLSAAAEGLGLEVDRFKSGRTGADVDFEPRTDIFENTEKYTIHLSLPGAKKSDVGVDWDGEQSVLRIAGVVHRPGVDEAMMRQLSVDGRKRETGVFEKTIRLGTRKDPASVDIAGITAKMVDGVLVIVVPKVERHFEKKEVRVDGSPELPVEQPEDAYMHEDDLLFDAEEGREEGATHAESTVPHPPTPPKASFGGESTAAPASKAKRHEAEQERARSETVDFEHPNTTVETLPKYEKEDSLSHNPSHEEDMSDWEKPGSEDEGDYVKINVD